MVAVSFNGGGNADLSVFSPGFFEGVGGTREIA